MRFALRALARTPAFTAIAVLTLAIGIGTNTAIFAIVDELIFEPTRDRSYDGVHQLYMRDPVSGRSGGVHIPDYEALVAHTPDGVTAVAAIDYYGGGLAQIPGRALRTSGWRVSGQFADVFAVRARLGRWINNEDNAGGAMDPKRTQGDRDYTIVRGRLGDNVVVISHRLWCDWFHESPDVVRTGTLKLNGQPTRIVGVAPAGFLQGVDVWTPFGTRRPWSREELEAAVAAARKIRPNQPPAELRLPTLTVMLRLASGAVAEQVSQRATALVQARPSTPEAPTGSLTIRPREGADTRNLRGGYIVLGFAALIFVAACANLGNMLFARAAEREGELAVRFSLGASRLAIFGMLAMEALIICALASAAGLVLAAGVLYLFADASPAFEVARWQRVDLDLAVDWRIAGFAMAGGLVAAALVAAGSLWRSSRVSLLTRLASSTSAVVARTEGRTLRTLLTSVQVTAAVLLLITTGMLLENTSRRLNRRVLFDTAALVTARIELPETYDPSRGRHFYTQVLERVRAMYGVEAAALADAIPGGEGPAPRRGVSAIRAEAPPRGLSGTPRRLDGQWIHASPGFVATLGFRVVRGRDFQATDEDGTEPVALVTASVAARLWPNDDPLDKRISCCGNTNFRRVVGVVPDPVAARYRPPSLDLSEAMQEAGGDTGQGVFVFLPAAQRFTPDMLVVARSTALRTDAAPLGQIVAALDPDVPVFDAGPVAATQFMRLSSEKAVRVLAGALGLISLGISVFGVYAIVSYFVSRRAREFGLRLALGATRRQIVKLVVDYAVHVMLVGLLPGVLFASLGTRYFQRELQNLQPNGITVWVFVPLLMLAAGIIAAWIPARRAVRVDPYSALKEL